MAALAVVENLDVIEYRVGQVRPGLPSFLGQVTESTKAGGSPIMGHPEDILDVR
jgi:hypothetical protein